MEYFLYLIADETQFVKNWDGTNIEYTQVWSERMAFDKPTDADFIRDQINAEIGAGTVGTSGPRK